MPTVTDQAVCIRHWDWSETSQTVSLFTRDLGIVRGVAKGAKRDHSRFSGGIEIATRGEVILRSKPGDALSLLYAWDLQEVFPSTRASLVAFHATMLLLDVTQRALHEHDPHPALFESLVASLRALAPDPSPLVVARYLWAVLEETGHRPDLTHDVASGLPLSPRQWYLFQPRLGGLSDPQSSPPADLDRERAWKVRHETVELLRAIRQDSARTAHAKALERGVRLLGAYARDLFRAELPTLDAFLLASNTPSRAQGE
jgi:DNA repair protein RecO